MSNLITLEELNAATERYCVYTSTLTTHSAMPHYHDYYQISFVTAGEVNHQQGNDCATLYAGDAFIVPPGFIHRIRFIDPGTKMFTLAFSESLFHTDFLQSNAFRFIRDLQAQYDSGAVHLQISLNPQQRGSLNALFQCLLNLESNSASVFSPVPSLVSAIVYLLAQCYYHNTKPPRQPWNNDDQAQLIRRCVVYVDTHFTEALNPDTVAKQFSLSRSVLYNAFQQHTGMPLHKYIAQKRIQKAQMLIRTQNNLPLTEIASRVGYEDSSTFYRNFVRITGISPAKYREQCSNTQP